MEHPLSINGTSTNNSEFFEPGSSYGKHIGISVSGPGTVVVSNISFVSPTQLTASFNTSGAPAGPYKVYVINPDGQKDSTTFSLANSCAITTATVATNTLNVSINKNPDITKTTIYPNPAHDILNVVNAKGDNYIIQVLDNKGYLLRQTQSSSRNFKINISNLAAGMYTIKIISGKNVEVQRFIKN